ESRYVVQRLRDMCSEQLRCQVTQKQTRQEAWNCFLRSKGRKSIYRHCLYQSLHVLVHGRKKLRLGTLSRIASLKADENHSRMGTRRSTTRLDIFRIV